MVEQKAFHNSNRKHNFITHWANNDFYFQVGRSASFKGSSAEEVPQAVVPAGGTGSLLRSGRGLRLGLGAVNRTAAATAKGKGPGPDQRSAPVYNQPVQPVSPATSLKPQGNTGKWPVFLPQVLGGFVFWPAIRFAYQNSSWCDWYSL